MSIGGDPVEREALVLDRLAGTGGRARAADHGSLRSACSMLPALRQRAGPLNGPLS